MILRQIRLKKMAGFCYLIGDESSKTCALVDPAFETDRILAEADNLGCKATHIINTHGHVFTGDTLFGGAIGRTDLPGGSHQQLIDSIHEKIYTLPAHTIVWPGHDYGPRPSSTVQLEKDTNPFTRP